MRIEAKNGRDTASDRKRPKRIFVERKLELRYGALFMF